MPPHARAGIRPRTVAGATAEAAGGGTQSIERAVALLLLVGRAAPDGARLADLVAQSALPKPTVRRVLLALVRTGLLDQDETTRRYHVGPEAYLLGTLAGSRYGIHALALERLSRIARATGDSVFLSVPRGTLSVCLHREEGTYPIRTHALQAGDRHPLGIGAGGLAILAALPDAEIERSLAANAEALASHYPGHTAPMLREAVAVTRARGYALNPGLYVAGSWGIGVVVRGPDGRPAGALSLAAIESRLSADRQRELVPLLKREAEALEAALGRRASPERPAPVHPAGRAVAKADP
ncbi:IclR family transcriptional regulator [Xanthobacter dioxanivorans]|uniref:IclR family transcriptional regulator n=1 Tax=Xanthobacter dioxanivorans TaxID=2528964 RepID=A0A974PSS4_9HYPH|nr:IclR family transcriptional regulator [Xanthobacter dioxanivorans]QRG08866.1 IclR family transcriptional regulator [Xanthobacter dioxanivorans]